MTIISRRSFLERGATLVAAGMAVPSFIAETARVIDGGAQFATAARAAGRKVLILVQFAGGNDGINTVIPFADPAYAAARSTIAIPAAQVLPLSQSVGLHPNMTRLKGRYDRGQVAVVQGVSYPNPNRSHFRGTDIWESAVPDRLEPTGWVGRYLQECGCQRPDHLEGMTVGSSQSAGSFWTEMALVPAVASISNFRYTSVNGGTSAGAIAQRNSEIQTLRTGLAQADGHPEGEFLRQSILTALADADILQAAAAGQTVTGVYPTNTFGQSLKLIAQLIAADVGTSVYYLSLGSFDTHSNQLAQQGRLLATFDQAVDAFMTDMEVKGRASDVALMTFSEFGRRLAQNGSAGTDHGVAAPMFVIGGGVQGGLHGEYPSLTDLTSGDLKMKVDFRGVYASVLQDLMSVAPASILGGTFAPLGLFGQLVNCSPRPRVSVGTQPTGDGRLLVTVTAGGGVIREIQFAASTNALVTVGNEVDRATAFAHRPAAPTAQLQFQVRRAGGGAAQVPMTVIDDCGPWPTFIGGGATAF